MSTTPRESLASATDEELVARLRLGDEVALRAIHRRYAALVFTIAARSLGPAAADEVVQDAFLTLWQKHQTFDPERGSFKSWITQIARRRASNELRRVRARGEHGDDTLDHLSDEALEPDEAHWAEHRRVALRAAVDALPAAQRQALSLAFFDELTHEQVAATLKAPIGTVKTRIRAAMKRLAPLVAMLLSVALVVVLLDRDKNTNERAEARALKMVTSSDVVPLLLEHATGTPMESHGRYRARSGEGVAVLTTTQLPTIVGGERYFAWARHGTHWSLLGVVEPRDGRSLLVVENDALATPPDEVRVTRETRAGVAPLGPIVIAWPAPP